MIEKVDQNQVMRGQWQTNLGAMMYDNVIVFSGGGLRSAFWAAIITIESPEGTAFTLPLYHPEGAAAAVISIHRSAECKS